MLLQLFTLLIPYQKVLVSQVRDVTSDADYFEASLPFLHAINELCKQATLVLKVAQVDFDEEVDVALVADFRHGVVVAMDLLALDVDLKLQVLARQVTERFESMLVVKSHAVDECVGCELLFHFETDRDRLMQLVDITAIRFQ